MGETTVVNVVRKRMRDGKPFDLRLFSVVEDQRIEELRIAGKTLAEISRELGRGKSSIQMRLAALARKDDGQ